MQFASLNSSLPTVSSFQRAPTAHHVQNDVVDVHSSWRSERLDLGLGAFLRVIIVVKCQLESHTEKGIAQDVVGARKAMPTRVAVARLSAEM